MFRVSELPSLEGRHETTVLIRKYYSNLLTVKIKLQSYFILEELQK